MRGVGAKQGEILMRIAVSGASGSVARNLVPLLVKAGHTVLLISRDPEKVTLQFPGLAVASTTAWQENARDYDVFVHLAVMNNNQPGSFDEFMEANANGASAFAESAQKAAIPRFVYPSTVQALMPGASSPYALSKIAGGEAVRASFSGAVDVVHLGLVHGQQYLGRLSFLNNLPRPLGSFVFSLLSALKPTTSVEQLARYITLPAPHGSCHFSILTDQKSQNFIYRLWRNLLGALFSVSVLLLIPALAVIWVLIVVEGGRPGVFIQERLGFRNHVFRCVKLRTMRKGTESKGSHMVDSDAVTKVGRLLRRLKIDELPQAWNVLRGEMVLIGPRPCLPTQAEVIAAREVREVVDYIPGLTGWAQINGVDMSDPQKLAAFDATYLALQSVLFDVKIIMKSLLPMRLLSMA